MFYEKTRAGRLCHLMENAGAVEWYEGDTYTERNAHVTWEVDGFGRSVGDGVFCDGGGD
jgi:hypothetical protein